MLRSILIDDETTSLHALRQKLAEHCPDVSIEAVCDSPTDGIEAIDSLQPDLVFLDIEMPLINGFTLLQQITFRNFELIFVTAYDHYAIKAIRFSALDYLVKPVEIDSLRAAVARAAEKKHMRGRTQQLELLLENLTHEKKKFKRLALPTVEGLQFVPIDDIIYLEASQNYTRLYLTGDVRYLASKSLKEFEEILPGDTFLRIHNSFLINKNFVEKYIRGDGGQVVLSNGAALDVAKRKKTEFLKAIGY